jgi:hypothetical protein
VTWADERYRNNGQRSEAEGVIVLDEVASFLGRYIAFPSLAAQTAVTLWVAHSHMVAEFESTPRLALLSPEPGSGKTRTLEVVELLVPSPQHVLNASTAAIFRLIDAARPTLLFDEVDAIFGRRSKDDGTEDLRGLLNAGHRRSATIPRCVGPTHKVEHFPVYAACALAGLGDLPDTLMTRSVVVRMRRRAPTEQIESFRRRVAQPEGHELRDYLAGWAETVDQACGDAWPEMPPGITDRPADVWEPLLAIADAAGGRWPTLAREACVELNQVRADTQSIGVKLLDDVHTVFGDDDHLATVTLIERLVALDESPWGDWYGKPIDSRWLAKHLKPYGITPTQIREGDSKFRGYRAGDFTDAWSRYLETSGTSGTGGTPQVSAPESVSDASHVPDVEAVHGTDPARDAPPLSRDVPDVPDVPALAGSDGEQTPLDLLEEAFGPLEPVDASPGQAANPGELGPIDRNDGTWF